MLGMLEWYNVVFAGPFGLAITYMIAHVLGFSGDSDHDAEFDHDFDHDFGIDHEVDHDVDPDHDFDHDTDDLTHSLEVAGEPGFLRSAAHFLGIGRVPVSILMMLSMFPWGLIGLWSNKILDSMGFPPFLYFWISLGCAGMGALTGLRFGAPVIARLMPRTTTFVTSRPALVGKRATVRFRLTETTGRVTLFDDHGTLHELPCIISSGEDPIPKGEEVYLVRYDDAKEVFVCRRNPLTGSIPDRTAS